MPSLEEQLIRAENLYISVRTAREREVVGKLETQVARTNNVSGRAHHNLEGARNGLALAEQKARTEFRTEVTREVE